MARSARCDVRRGAAVFVESDETTVLADALFFEAFRRFLLQIGGANIAGAGGAVKPPSSSSLVEERTPPLAPPPNGGARSG